MNGDKAKQFISISVLGRVIAAFLLFYALKRHPYSYFTLLRWVVTIVSVYSAYVASRSKATPWLVLFIGVAILFNPVAPIGMARETWAIVDVIAGIFLLASIAFVREV